MKYKKTRIYSFVPRQTVALLLAIKYFGSQKEIAKKLNITQQGVSHYIKSRRTVSPFMAEKIEKITKGLVTKNVLLGKGRRQDLVKAAKHLNVELISADNLSKDASLVYQLLEKYGSYTNVAKALPEKITSQTIKDWLNKPDLVLSDKRIKILKKILKNT